MTVKPLAVELLRNNAGDSGRRGAARILEALRELDDFPLTEEEWVEMGRKVEEKVIGALEEVFSEKYTEEELEALIRYHADPTMVSAMGRLSEVTEAARGRVSDLGKTLVDDIYATMPEIREFDTNVILGAYTCKTVFEPDINRVARALTHVLGWRPSPEHMSSPEFWKVCARALLEQVPELGDLKGDTDRLEKMLKSPNRRDEEVQALAAEILLKTTAARGAKISLRRGSVPLFEAPPQEAPDIETLMRELGLA